LPLAAALRHTPRVVVDDLGVEDVRHGRALAPLRLAASVLPAEGSDPVAVLDTHGELIALGRLRGGRVEIARGSVRLDGPGPGALSLAAVSCKRLRAAARHEQQMIHFEACSGLLGA